MRLGLATSLTVVLTLSGRAAADDAAPARSVPRPRPKIESPFLTGLVGSWDVTKEGGGGNGPRATARVTSVLDGTALVEELTYEGGAAFTVLCVGADAAGVTTWRFSSEEPGEVLVERGALSADGIDLQSETGLSTRLAKTADGFAATTKGGNRIDATWRYAKAAKDAPAAAPAPSPPFLGSLVGDFTVTGTFRMGTTETPSSGRAALAPIAHGVFSRMDYDADAGGRRKRGLAVAGLGEDAKAFTYWWFTDYFDGPTLVTGQASDKEWKGKAETSPLGPFDMTWTRTATGFDLLAHFGAATLSETFAKK